MKPKANKPQPADRKRVFNLSAYCALTVQFICGRGLALSVRMENRRFDKLPPVYFDVRRNGIDEQMNAYFDVHAPMVDGATEHTCTIRRCRDKDVMVWFTNAAGRTLFVVHINHHDSDEPAAWFNAYDAEGFELTAQCVQRTGATSLSAGYGPAPRLKGGNGK